MLLGAVAAVAFGAAWPIGALAGILVGIGAAAVTHLLLGSPQGLLTAEQVDIGLADLGIEADSVVAAEDQLPGEALWRAHVAGGADLRVKVYGRDAWDSQFVGSVWASLTRRGEMPSLGGGRESRVEHEALVTLMAAAGRGLGHPARQGRALRSGRRHHRHGGAAHEPAAPWTPADVTDDTARRGMACPDASSTQRGHGARAHRQPARGDPHRRQRRARGLRRRRAQREPRRPAGRRITAAGDAGTEGRPRAGVGVGAAGDGRRRRRRHAALPPAGRPRTPDAAGAAGGGVDPQGPPLGRGHDPGRSRAAAPADPAGDAEVGRRSSRSSRSWRTR